LLDWLDEDQVDDTVTEPTLPGEDLPDWLAQEGPEAVLSELNLDQVEPADKNESSEDIPDWLEEGEKPESDQPEEIEPEDELSPDWLAQEEPEAILSELGLDQVVPSEKDDSIEDSLPDWLAGMEPEPAISKVASDDYIQDDESLPNWMAEVEEEESSTVDAPIEEQTDSGEVPDWLADAADSTGLSPFQDETVSEEDGIPDWLSGAAILSAAGAEALQDDDTTVSPDPVSDQEPEWLTEAFATQLEESEDSDESSEEIPDWLDTPGKESDTLPALPVDESSLDFLLDGQASGDMDWLAEAEVSGEGAAPTGELVDDDELDSRLDGLVETQMEGDVDLSPANLPGWLEAMRPVDGLDTTGEIIDANAPVEGAGPLAGLRGVLPAEPDISYLRKPSAISIKLQVSEAQRANSVLLKQLVESESDVRPVPTQTAITSQYILRILIGVVLIFTILIPMVAGIPNVTIPMSPAVAAEVLVVSQLVGSHSPGRPVLLAVDYEPGWSGEMDIVTGVVVDDLTRQGSYIVLVSTVPTGPIQAEGLVASVSKSGNYQYIAPDQYINMGFIPGGPAGVLSFAAAPREIIKSAMSDNFLDSQAWNREQLKNVNTVSDFGMVIVASENPDTIREWMLHQSKSKV